MTSLVESDQYSGFIHEVPKLKQRSHWDCGITCVLMVLPDHAREHFLANFDTVCEQEGFGHSTWTIDLCYLLKRYNVKHKMFSTTLGVNTNNSHLNYYNKILDKDRVRVERRFAEAAARGVRCCWGAPSSQALLTLLRRGPLLMLVDAKRLRCLVCQPLAIFASLASLAPFKGHYVLCVGWQRAQVVLVDPARRDASHRCRVSLRSLLRAHHQPGTDRDLIAVSLSLSLS